MKVNLVRFSVDGRVVGSINKDGELKWDDLTALKNFADRFLRMGLVREDYDTDTVSITAVDIDLMSLNPTKAGEASVKLEFNQVEKLWKAMRG